MLTLKDKLSHLSYPQACKLLGPEGKHLIMEGGKFDIDLYGQVTLDNDRFQLKLSDAVVDLALDPLKPKRLSIGCSICTVSCVHQGAALSLILEEKMALGLAAPPPERVPMESLSEPALIKRAIADRRLRALTEKMRLRSMDPQKLWTDYVITNQASGKSYRIALRGWQPGESYCSCPDFRKNTLGTCKHIIYALKRGQKKFSKAVRETSPEVKDVSVYLKYGRKMQLGLLIPNNVPADVIGHLTPLLENPIEDMKDLIGRIQLVEKVGSRVIIYPDAEEFIDQKLFQQRMAQAVVEIRKDPVRHPLRTESAEGRAAPLPAGWHRLCRRRRAGDPGR